MAMIEDRVRNIEKNLQEEKEKETVQWGNLDACENFIACIKPRGRGPQ
jgi:hypothetical protein